MTWRPAIPRALSLCTPVAEPARDVPWRSARMVRTPKRSNLRSIGPLAVSHKGLSGLAARKHRNAPAVTSPHGNQISLRTIAENHRANTH